MKHQVGFSPETVQYLTNRHGGIYLTVDQVAQELGWKSARSVLNAIDAERLPIPTVKIGRRRMVDARDFARFIDRNLPAVT